MKYYTMKQSLYVLKDVQWSSHSTGVLLLHSKVSAIETNSMFNAFYFRQTSRLYKTLQYCGILLKLDFFQNLYVHFQEIKLRQEVPRTSVTHEFFTEDSSVRRMRFEIQKRNLKYLCLIQLLLLFTFSKLQDVFRDHKLIQEYVLCHLVLFMGQFLTVYSLVKIVYLNNFHLY